MLQNYTKYFFYGKKTLHILRMGIPFFDNVYGMCHSFGTVGIKGNNPNSQRELGLLLFVWNSIFVCVKPQLQELLILCSCLCDLCGS